MGKLILITICFLSTSTAWSWNIKKLQGDVTVQTQNQEQNAELNMQLSPGDVIKTGPRARVLLVEDGSSVWLGQKTVFKLKEVVKGKPTLLEVVYGKIRALVVPKQAKKYRYKMKALVAGVRGTEFFAEVNENARICTLEGEVFVQQKYEDDVSIPAGKGVLFAKGEYPIFSDNSAFLVDRWVAETSFEPEISSIESFYDQPYRKHEMGSNWYWGLNAIGTFCETMNSDYNIDVNDKNRTCARAYISPFIQYGKKHRVFVRPAANLLWLNTPATFDNNPTTFGGKQETLTLAEGFVETNWDSVSTKLGLQEVQWNEGILISGRRWSTEPITYMALQTRIRMGDWRLDLLGVDGQETTYPLDGISQVSFVGAKLDFPEAIGNIYALYAKFPGFQNGLSRLHYGREVFNVGFYRKAKFGAFDYKLSVIFQDHANLIRLGNQADSADGNLMDLELGWNFGTRRPWRISLRRFAASDDFAPIRHDYYLLGLSHTLKHPANLTQYRAKIEWQVKPRNLVYIDYMMNFQKSKDGFIKEFNTTEDNTHVGSEINLVYSTPLFDSLHGFFGVYTFFPGTPFGSDPSHGFFSRLEYNF